MTKAIELADHLAQRLGIAIDPLDGSSNIDVNVAVGTIFSIMPAEAAADATFLRPGHEHLAAGYVILCDLRAPDHAGRDRGRRCLALQARSAPARLRADRHGARHPRRCGGIRHQRLKPPPLARADPRLVRRRAAGRGRPPRGRDINMRCVASVVAEAYRIIIRGGVFLFPCGARPGHAEGRLRMVYEYAPMAMLIEQAGGAATDGRTLLLDLAPSEESPLFGVRGLFNA
jgi:fructose-1,6-bisphosphatase I